ncbi:hypothetical protein [Arthrobacter sp. 7Tela_A1]|uniref:hypothetical protein n=1 Tax=Arthrobacter sp. 7Tela_A1 TaxID=3093745 RepID=UPI003BB66D15
MRYRRALLAPKTLRAGIAVGAAGILIALLTNPFMANFGALTYNGENGFFVTLTQIVWLAPEACLSFSAALVAAALVMRCLDTARSSSVP